MLLRNLEKLNQHWRRGVFGSKDSWIHLLLVWINNLQKNVF